MKRFRRATLFLLVTVAVHGTASGLVSQTTATDPTLPESVAAGRAVGGVAGAEPVLELRGVLATPPSSEVLKLRADLERLVRGLATSGSSHGVLVVSLDRGDTLFSLNPDLPLAPASNMKLYTTAAALYYLGPSFRYSTYVLADGPVRDGVLFGDVVLYGTGDPAMSSRMMGVALSPFRALADSLLTHGIREIRGDIVGDGSYFDDSFIGDGWREEYRLDSYSAPIGALSLAENVINVRVTPGASAGQPAVIRTTPATTGLLVQNRVTTTASGSSSVRFSYDPDGLVIEGRIPRRHPGVSRTVTVVDPGNFAAAAFREVLEEAGVTVLGSVRTVRDPWSSQVGATALFANEGEGSPPQIVGTHFSPTLAEVTSVTNHVSQNLFAEALFKTVGRVALGDGSFEAGARAVQEFLESEKPLDFSAIQIVDGSGLSPINRVTARSTVHLLDLMTRTDVWDSFYQSLPEAASPEGGQHSLRSRMGRTAAALNLRAKTGTISNVSSLSGYVRAANGEMLAFSIFANGVRSTARAKGTEDAIGVRLAQFTRPAEGTTPDLIGEPLGSSEPVPLTDDSVGGPVSASPPTSLQSTETPATPARRTHRVVSGDTLEEIAQRYDTTVTELRRLNPGIQPRRLRIGQSLTVPTP